MAKYILFWLVYKIPVDEISISGGKVLSRSDVIVVRSVNTVEKGYPVANRSRHAIILILLSCTLAVAMKESILYRYLYLSEW